MQLAPGSKAWAWHLFLAGAWRGVRKVFVVWIRFFLGKMTLPMVYEWGYDDTQIDGCTCSNYFLDA